MAPIQDTIGTYPVRMAAAYAGMIAELNGNRDVASRKIETAAVAFGLAVGRGTADGSAKLAGAGFEGITVADKTRSADQYAVGEVAGVIRKGAVWVIASNNVTPADPVTFTAATGVIGAGLVTTIAGAKFETTALAGALVRVYLG
jgi:hypothetical protein